MRYSLILATLTAVAIAAPMGPKDTEIATTMNAMNDAKQASDGSYGAYGQYADYADYGAYPGDVEQAANAMGNANMKHDDMNNYSEMMTDADVADAMRKESFMTDEAAASHMKRKEMASNKMMMGAKAANMEGVEKAEVMKKDVMKKDVMMKDVMKKDVMMKDNNDMVDAKQAADTSYGSYGKYGAYADYDKYTGGVEEEAQEM